MSAWVDIRDTVVKALEIKEVGKKMKDDFVDWLGSEGVDFAQKFVDKIIEECKTDAPNESGWCKIRDSLVIPTALNVVMYVLKTVLTKAAEQK
jgi:hypothetical protein